MKNRAHTLISLAMVAAFALPALAQTGETKPRPAADSALRIEELTERTAADPSDAAAWTQLGILYIDEGMLPEARDAFISALQAAPTEPSSHLNLAVCLVRMEKWSEAQAPLSSYRQMVPEDVRGWALGGQAAAESGDLEAGIALWLEGAELAEIPEADQVMLVISATGLLLHADEEDPAPNEDELRRAAKILHTERDLVDGAEGAQLRNRRDYVWLELARMREEAGDVEGALEDFENLRAAGSENPAAWIKPAQLLLDAHRVEDARAIARDAAAVLPGSAIVEFLNGRVADEEGNAGLAARHYRKAADLDPDLAGVWPALGEALAKSGDTRGASEALAEAVRRGEGGAAAAYNMGVVLSQKNQFAKAIPYLEEAIRTDPDHRDAYKALGTAFRKQKRFADGAKVYQAAIDRFGPDGRMLYQLGYCEAKEGRHAEAAVHYEMVTMMDPKNVNAFYGLGNARSKAGDQDGAVEAYRAALELKSDFHGASFGWALALQKKGDFEGAIERYELTLDLKETYSSYVNMAICYQNLGDEEASEEYYALAAELKKKGR